MPELKDCINRIFESDIQKLIISKPADKSCEYKKITVMKMPKFYQIAKYTEKQVFHENIPLDGIATRCFELTDGCFRQINAFTDGKEIYITISGKGKIVFKQKALETQTACAPGHIHKRGQGCSGNVR